MLGNFFSRKRQSGISALSLRTPARILILIAGLATAATGQETPAQHAGFDSATGKSLKAYPPHPLVDYKHMRLEITIPDMEIPKASVVQTLTFAPSAPLRALSLDARSLVIESVQSSGQEVTFNHDGKKLNIAFGQELAAGQDVTIVTTYRIENPASGMIWTPSSSAFPNRAAQLHTQGQPQTNSYWFPCHDYPNERLTTELVVLAPAGYEVCSNGRLVDVTKQARLNTSGPENQLTPYRRWHWLQDKPHVNYLVTLVVGRFDVVDVSDVKNGSLPMPVYVPPGRGADAATTYSRTPAMINFFANLLSEPYPWDKYAQLVVWNFGAGGMENTSATTMFDTAVIGKDDQDDHDLDGLISHELAHQWFGDLITCNSWEHVWLNEGFATYLTSLWFEHRDGADAYARNIQGSYDAIIGADTTLAPAGVGMVSKVYEHPWETFRRPANPYSKGSSILHMLRMRLGDAAFFRGVGAYVDEHKFSTVETADLRRALEAASGDSLEQFFAQWCGRPGVPMISVRSNYDSDKQQLTVTVDQNQTVNADNPAFEFKLPVTFSDGSLHNVSIDVTGKSTSAAFPCTAEPTFISIDPAQHVLAGIRNYVTDAQALSQATTTQLPVSARVMGLRTLAANETTVDVKIMEALAQMVRDAHVPVWVRIEAVRTLVATKSYSDLRSIASTYNDSWEVREIIAASLPAVVDAQASALPAIANVLDHMYNNDSSLKVRCAALRSLARIKAPQTVAYINKATLEESQHDSLRTAAIEAAALLASDETIDQTKLLDLVLVHTKEGFDPRTQASAAAAAATLAKADPERTIAALAELLEKGKLRAQLAAGDALVAIGDTRGIVLIENALVKSGSEDIAWQAGRWLRSLRASPKGTETK